MMIGSRDVSEPRITVPEVAKQLGYPYSARANMMAGDQMRKMFEDVVGRRPHTELRQKSNPNAKKGSTHDIAVYPLNWLKRMEEIVHAAYQKASPLFS